jgi:hypothetical protein
MIPPSSNKVVRMRALMILALLWCASAAAQPASTRLSGEEAIVAVPADGFVEIARKHVLKDKQGRFVYCAEIADRVSFSAKDECARFVTAAGYVRLRTENPEAIYVAMGLRRSIDRGEDRIVLFYRIP